MATIKSYTDIEQSKKLAEFLPLETADNVIVSFGGREGVTTVVMPNKTLDIIKTPFSDIREVVPCWSLASLLDILKDKFTFGGASDKDWFVAYTVKTPRELLTIYESNLVDACVAMIEKLHKLNLL